MINVDFENSGFREKDIDNGSMQKLVRKAHENLRNMDRSIGTGWVELPMQITKNEILNLKKLAKEVQDKSSVLLVLGIGGSYLGAYSAIKALKRECKTQVIFLGTDLNSYEIIKTLEDCKQKDVSVNVISKSGTTTETAIAFQLVETFMKKKYKKGNEYRNRIFVTTDYEKGALRQTATREGYTSFVIPRTCGGRYSVLSAVGLFPMAVAGINIEKVLAGAQTAYSNCFEFNCMSNFAYRYAILRYLMYTKHKKSVELTCTFDDRLVPFLDWHRQLFAESEGKNGKGLFVSSARYTTDLHSIGQFVQEGSPILFETILDVYQPEEDIKLENIQEGSGIEYLEGKLLSDVNKCAKIGVVKSHSAGKAPVIRFEIDNLNEETFGELVYTFETACAVSAYMIGVNPFDQPGVEGYKKFMKEELRK